MHFVHDLVQMTYITTIQNHSTGWELIEKCSLHFDFSDVADLENRPRISTQVWLGEAQLRLWLHTFRKIFAFMSPGKNSKLKGFFPGPADYANIYHVAVTHTHTCTHLILNTAGGVGGGGCTRNLPSVSVSGWQHCSSPPAQCVWWTGTFAVPPPAAQCHGSSADQHSGEAVAPPGLSASRCTTSPVANREACGTLEINSSRSYLPVLWPMWFVWQKFMCWQGSRCTQSPQSQCAETAWMAGNFA